MAQPPVRVAVWVAVRTFYGALRRVRRGCCHRLDQPLLVLALVLALAQLLVLTLLLALMVLSAARQWQYGCQSCRL